MKERRREEGEIGSVGEKSRGTIRNKEEDSFNDLHFGGDQDQWACQLK